MGRGTIEQVRNIAETRQKLGLSIFAFIDLACDSVQHPVAQVGTEYAAI